MFELLFLLLPLAAMSGWWLGRRNKPSGADNNSPEIPLDYLKGLNYILNEQPDKAIEIFIEMLQVDTETVETHLALGSLFRRRGEVDRAIRIHQNLIARPSLRRGLRDQALFELGHDYMRAGLLDRAETLFSELIDDGSHNDAALRQLIDIYQQEKDWAKAIETARRLEMRVDSNLDPIIAQYYCELAEQAERQGETTQAKKTLRRALATDPNCVRASLIEGRLMQVAGDFKVAIKAYRRVEQQDPDYLPEVIAPMLECFRRMGQTEEMETYLDQIQASYGGISAVLTCADILRTESNERAEELIINHLQRHPSLHAMDRLIDIKLQGSEGVARENLQMLKEVTGKLLEDRAVYMCGNCGFHGKTLHWQCPSCKNWNTIKPIQGAEGEL